LLSAKWDVTQQSQAFPTNASQCVNVYQSVGEHLTKTTNCQLVVHHTFEAQGFFFSIYSNSCSTLVW